MPLGSTRPTTALRAGRPPSLRAWQAASRPLLYVTAFGHPETGEVTLELLNSGGCPALGTTLLFISGSSVARGRIGNLAAGRRLVLTTADVTMNPSGGLLSCYEDDRRRVAQTYFLHNDVRRRYRKRWWRDAPSDEEMFAHESPDISLDGLEESRFIRRCSPSRERIPGARRQKNARTSASRADRRPGSYAARFPAIPLAMRDSAPSGIGRRPASLPP